MKNILYAALMITSLSGSSFSQEAKSLFDRVEDLKVVSQEKMQQASTFGQKAKDALVKAEDIMGNLDLSMDDIKAKVASLDKDQLLAYASKYKSMLSEHEDKIAVVTGQLKEMNWFKRLGTQGKALKATAAGYTEKLNTLKGQYSVYTEQLKSFGIDLSTYGL